VAGNWNCKGCFWWQQLPSVCWALAAIAFKERETDGIELVTGQLDLISHGFPRSPMLAIQESPAHQFLLGLEKTFPKPKAILVASAHWGISRRPGF
jgi:hypothetical protein